MMDTEQVSRASLLKGWSMDQQRWYYLGACRRVGSQAPPDLHTEVQETVGHTVKTLP